MKPNKTNAEYIRRINKAIEYIISHLDSAIALDDVAQASHFSSFHFHRIFHGIIGETVNEFVNRKRMEKAVCTLLNKPQLTVTEVAELGGFSSSANFAKAFKLYFGLSPSQLRQPKYNNNSKIGKIYSKYGKAFNSQDLYSQFVTDSVIFEPNKLEDLLMNVKVQAMEEKTMAFLTAPQGYELESIFSTWDKLSAWAEASGINNYKKKRFAICHDNPMVTPTEQCRYDACIEVDERQVINSPFSPTTIPAGNYAVAHYKGDGDKVSHFYMELYSHWLANSGFEPDNFPPIAYYWNDSRQDGFVEMDVYIKVKPLMVS